MSDETTIVSKVLVHECNEDALSILKTICTTHNLVGLKVSTGDNSIGIKDASNEIDDVLTIGDFYARANEDNTHLLFI